jgi:formate-dependent nitrite reductase membrane component NrfD
VPIDVTTTRLNHLVDPVLHVWAWQIPVYLFLGGLVAGLMVISGWLLLTTRQRPPRSVVQQLPVIGLAGLTAGMLALFLDLEHKLYVWRLYVTFEWRSPMSWGAWILVAVYPALVATMLLSPPAWLLARVPRAASLQARLRAFGGVERVIGWTNLALGGLLGIYTGVLLSSLGARPAWSSALLGPLFLASGLSSAAALAHVIARDRGEHDALVRADNRLLLAELAILLLFLVGLGSSTRAHRAAADLFLGGAYTAAFWVGVVLAGIVLPLIVQSLVLRRRVAHTIVAPMFVLAGGLMLRFVIVSAGQASHWRAF